MTETLRAPTESGYDAKKEHQLADKLRAKAQSAVRNERPVDAPRHELFSTALRTTAEGKRLTLVEDWQSEAITGTPELHDKRVHFVELVDHIDDTGKIYEVPEIIATFHELQPFDSDGETLGYAPATPMEGVTLKDIGTLLMAFENPAQTAAVINIPRNVGGLALQSSRN